jgi:prevent-host-death family protein
LKTVAITQAKRRFAALIAEVEAGEELVITRYGVPAGRMIPFAPVSRRKFGALAGLVAIDDRFFEPLPPDELEGWS